MWSSNSLYFQGVVGWPNGYTKDKAQFECWEKVRGSKMYEVCGNVLGYEQIKTVIEDCATDFKVWYI